MDNLETIREVSPRYAALLQRDSELSAELAELIPRGRELTEARHRSGTPTWTNEAPRQKPAPVVRHAGAEALLGELLPPQPEHETNPPPLPEPWKSQPELREVSAKVEALVEAQKLIGPEIEKARREYSRQAAEQHAKTYAKIAGEVVAAARKLGDAVLAHHEFINQLRLDGVGRKDLRPVNLQGFGDLEGGTVLFDVIRHAIELGHIDAKQLPTWKLPASLQILNII